MTGKLYIAKSGAKAAPTLPTDAITRTFGVLGQRGTGKTTTAAVLAEEIAKRGGHVAVADPVGAWWGITRNGEGRGIKGIVIGGEHGDVPLEETGGQLVADLVVQRHWPVVVIDLKLMRKGAQLRFMADYLEALFQANRAPLHQVFEEADRFLPQQGRRTGKEDLPAARTLGAGEDIVKLGRSRGLGATLVTQRPATINKNVLEQVEGLVVHRLLGPNDQKAIRSWIEANGDPRATEDVMRSLASLKLGEAWLYSPVLGLLDRIRVRNRKTFDSSSTPTTDVKAIEEETTRAPVDIDELREQMAETVERAKANDPKHLKRRITELEKRLDERPEIEPEVVEVEKLVPDEDALHELISLIGEGKGLVEQLDELVKLLTTSAPSLAEQLVTSAANVRDAVTDMERHAAQPAQPEAPRRQQPRAPATAPARPPGAAPRPASPGAPQDNGELPKGALELLVVAARHHPLRLTKAQLATLAKRGTRSSTLEGHLAKLAKAGLLDRHGGAIGVTDAGLQLAGVEPVELNVYTWQDVLPAGVADLFAALNSLGGVASKAAIAEHAGVSATSSTTEGKLAVLRRNGLVEHRAGEYVLTQLAYGS